MKIRHTAFVISLSYLLTAPLVAQTITGGTCSAANLKGTYALNLGGRGISSTGTFTGSYQSNGTATFDGVSAVTFAGTVNTNLATGKSFTYSGTYTVPSNCYGTITLTTGSTATFTLVVWSSGRQFNIVGSDSTYVYAGGGDNFQPSACATSSLSGPYAFTGSGFTLSGTTQNGAADESGVLQFDGQGGATASYSVTSAGAAASSVTSSGTYSVTSGCTATATLTDSNGKTNTLNIVVTGIDANALDILAANSQFVRTGQARSAFSNPTESIGNVASYTVNATPPGSVFVLFGVGLSARQVNATTVPLPTTLLNTTVTVNGEQAPLFFIDTGQIDAQMPWDIPAAAVATVIVKNGTATSNAAAVFVPSTATPGLSVYNTNRAVIVNKDGSVNSAAAGAAVGDEVVAYFTGGGPVQNASAQVTGHAAPSGLSPTTGNWSVTVGGVQAPIVDYIGLTPGSVGLYQANFRVPQLARGTYPVVITIGGQASTNTPVPLMTVTN